MVQGFYFVTNVFHAVYCLTEPHSDICILLMIEGRKVLQKAEDRIKGVWMSREAEEDLDVEKYLITDGVLK